MSLAAVSIRLQPTSGAAMKEAMWAHVRVNPVSDLPVPHLLDDHLKKVSDLAGTFAEGFGKDWAQLAGLWHDLGKFRPGFQHYIRQANNVDAHIEGRINDRDKTHSAAGALWAEKLLSDRFGPPGQLMSRVLQ
jgi:CRISPR-associated endonuclease/helicase Cas3